MEWKRKRCRFGIEEEKKILRNDKVLSSFHPHTERGPLYLPPLTAVEAAAIPPIRFYRRAPVVKLLTTIVHPIFTFIYFFLSSINWINRDENINSIYCSNISHQLLVPMATWIIVGALLICLRGVFSLIVVDFCERQSIRPFFITFSLDGSLHVNSLPHPVGRDFLTSLIIILDSLSKSQFYIQFSVENMQFSQISSSH